MLIQKGFVKILIFWISKNRKLLIQIQIFSGVWYNLKKYENKYQKSFDCGMTSFQWDGNSINRTLCEKRRYAYMCFNGVVKFLNPETRDGHLLYEDNKFSK